MTDEHEEALRWNPRSHGKATEEALRLAEQAGFKTADPSLWTAANFVKLIRLARAQPHGEPDKPRAELLDKTLRQRAHELRREACSAWSAVIGKGDIDAAKCEYARAVEDRLRCAIDELADASRPAQAVPEERAALLRLRDIVFAADAPNYLNVPQDSYVAQWFVRLAEAVDRETEALFAAPKSGGKG